MLESSYSGRVRGLKSNRQYGLQAAASKRADEQLRLERARMDNRQTRRGLGSGVSQPAADEGTFFSRDAARSGLGSDQGIQIIKPPDGLIQDGQQSGFALARRERKILDALQSRGINAARAQLNADGSIEVLSNDGHAGVIDPLNAAKILQSLDPEAQKEALRQRELNLRERGLDLQEKSQKKKTDTELVTVDQQRKHTILNNRVTRAVRRLTMAQDADVQDKGIIAAAQAAVDRAEQDLDSFLGELFPDQQRENDIETRNNAKQKKLDELQAIAESSQMEDGSPRPLAQRKEAMREWKKLKGISPTAEEVKQDKIRVAQEVVADKDNQDPVDVLNSEAVVSVAKKQATEAAQAALNPPKISEGTIITNKQTGQRMIAKDGQWQEL